MLCAVITLTIIMACFMTWALCAAAGQASRDEERMERFIKYKPPEVSDGAGFAQGSPRTK